MEGVKKSETHPAISEEIGEKSREHLFRALVMEKLLGETEDALRDHDFSDEEIDAFERELRALPSERILGVLSIPYELRKTIFSRARERIDLGKEDVASWVRWLDARAQERGFTLGYHVSKTQIPRLRDQRDPDKETWMIRGNELDDRDDMKMAYYSLDYQNLFRKNRGMFLYLVRAEIGDETAHKRDIKNNWGRANMLSVIAEFDLLDMERQIDDLIR
ncbi:MAG: hypothetical protein AAB916_01520 [Patescibacteria group bacterium]